MAIFREFFTFEMRFRMKSISTYVYFLAWFAFSFFCVASESFGPVGSANGKVLLNRPYANSLTDFFVTRHRPRLSRARLAAGRPAILRIQHGDHPHRRLL
jgi:hypothetical protein